MMMKQSKEGDKKCLFFSMMLLIIDPNDDELCNSFPVFFFKEK